VISAYKYIVYNVLKIHIR